ncbi:hypothetical protein YPPY45_0913 [Yersinia pestis PY-45]|uniref:PyrBI operon attenuator n=1 Tax=Yersinia pestis PY-08 TaxID=992134 RepID=A0AB72ZRD3_YERPE|nr:hypothetical protein YPPY08_0981 [Yersinia pestis PY-08]EIR37193.1 hypothetical protein YPPY10_0979 [Yersinia pestis PY-10]EIR96392.1 hypothetical protein YPPY45_0913 [Yersinia pestis PY-45]EIS77791.1 hypothetical protein YPPY71_1865 [Yersinia pestis PY-71]
MPQDGDFIRRRAFSCVRSFFHKALFFTIARPHQFFIFPLI